jgi:hypothetical protein
MGQVDLSDRMVNKYSIITKTWRRTIKLLFHSSYLNFPNSFIPYKSCGGNMTVLKFRGQLVRDLVLSDEESTESVVCQGAGPAVRRLK